MTLNDTQKALLTLLAQALWGNGGALVEADWEQVEELAKDQGVLPMLYRGAIKYKDIIPAERIRIWRGAMYAAILQNDHMNQAQSEILGWLSEKGIRAAILKGTSVARYYTPSDMRCLGDIDLLIDQAYLDLASEVLKEHGYRLNEHEHDFHISFVRGDITLELHYKASVVPNGKGGQFAAKIMGQFLDEVTLASTNDVSFPVLSEKYQALMLLVHMERHMMNGGVGLRQLCDWAVYVHSTDETEWQKAAMPMLQSCGLLTYAKVITKTCIKYLGLPPENVDWSGAVDDHIIHEMMYDVFRAGNLGHADDKGAGNIFSDRRLLGGKRQSRISGLLLYLNDIAYKNCPISRKCKILLPLLWIFLPLRYYIRSLFGIRPKKNVPQVLIGANKRRKLYKDLHLYELDC